MKYLLKGLVQFKGVFHVIKIPFGVVGLGKAMTPWISDEIVNKVTEQFIVQTQNLVSVGKTDDVNFDVFMIEVSVGNFTEDYRLYCIDLLIELVKKNLRSLESLDFYEKNSSLINLASSSGELVEYEFFNPHTTLNMIKGFSGIYKNYEDEARVNHLMNYIRTLATDMVGKSASVYLVNKGGVNIYSLNEDWVKTLNATEIPFLKFFGELSKDLLGRDHSLGEFVFHFDTSTAKWQEMALRNGQITSLSDPDATEEFYLTLKRKVASALFGKYLDVQLNDEMRQKFLKRFLGHEAIDIIYDLNETPLAIHVFYKDYFYAQNSRDFLKYKDKLIYEVLTDYMGYIQDNLMSIDLNALREVIKNQCQCSIDSGYYIQTLVHEYLIKLVYVNTEESLSIFDEMNVSVIPLLGSIFNRNISMEFGEVLQREELDSVAYFGMKIVREEPIFEVIEKMSNLEVLKDVDELIICKPCNAEKVEILLFNKSWDMGLKKQVILEVGKRFTEIESVEVSE